MSRTAVPPSTFRSVRFESAEDFIHEVQPHDGPFLSLTLGMAVDYHSAAASHDPRTTPAKHLDRGTFHAIYDSDRLILVLVQTPLRPAHYLGYPSPPAPPVLAAACALLARGTAPSSLARGLGGPRDAVAALLAALPAVRPSPKTASSIACSANLRTLPPPAPRPGKLTRSAEDADATWGYHIRSASPGDAPALVPLVLEAAACTPAGPPVSAQILAAAASKMIYVISASDSEAPRATSLLTSGSANNSLRPGERAALVGYLLLGLATPRTVAIRHVFVHPAHRHRGLAEALVRAVTRACLGAPLEADAPRTHGAGVDAPGCGAKSAVCVFCDGPRAARLYGRCGFVVDEGARDVATGESVCYAYEEREIITP